MREILAYCSPILLTFACLVTYHYIRDLRQRLDFAKEHARHAWRQYTVVNRELLTLQGKPTPPTTIGRDTPEKQKEKPDNGFRIGRIGPSQIVGDERQRLDHDLRRGQTTVAAPTIDEIASALSEVGENGELG